MKKPCRPRPPPLVLSLAMCHTEGSLLPIKSDGRMMVILGMVIAGLEVSLFLFFPPIFFFHSVFCIDLSWHSNATLPLIKWCGRIVWEGRRWQVAGPSPGTFSFFSLSSQVGRATP